MRREGAIPDRVLPSGTQISEENAEQTIGRRFRINDKVWADAFYLNDEQLWEEMEGEAPSGSVGTMDVATDGSFYSLRWDPTAEMRFGYTLMTQEIFDDLFRRGVLVEVWL